MVLTWLLRGWESRTKKEEDQALCRQTHAVENTVALSLLRKRLKRYNFQVVQSNGVETIYSPYTIFGIGMMELELETHFPHQYAWLGL